MEIVLHHILSIFLFIFVFDIVFAIISQFSLRAAMILALNKLSISAIGLLGMQSRCPLKHRAAQQFSNSRNFKDCKMFRNICFLTMSFATVNRRNARLAHRPSFAPCDESALWNGLIRKETEKLSSPVVNEQVGIGQLWHNCSAQQESISSFER